MGSMLATELSLEKCLIPLNTLARPRWNRKYEYKRRKNEVRFQKFANTILFFFRPIRRIFDIRACLERKEKKKKKRKNAFGIHKNSVYRSNTTRILYRIAILIRHLFPTISSTANIKLLGILRGNE